MIIAVDLMSENGPQPTIEGVKLALKKGTVEAEELVVIGRPTALKLTENFLPPQSQLCCDETIPMGEKFSYHHRRCLSSLNLGFNGLRDKTFSAFVSPGETGFMVGLAVTVLGTVKTGLKPAIALPIPNKNDYCLLLDAGAWPEADADDLVNYARMGEIYCRKIYRLAKPIIKMLNIGSEPTKGTDSMRLAYRELTAAFDTFRGNIEPTGLFVDDVNVVVCPGILGNIALKTAEGVINRFGFLGRLIKLAHRNISPERVGGAQLLGVKGTPIVTHGNIHPRDLASAIRRAKEAAELKVAEAIATEFQMV
ncbi:MAG TPA: hypothetical protein PKM52_02215 [bacterium]|nr:hypothetical protein [bacterium]